MANKLRLNLDRTYSYGGKHYGPGRVEFEEGEQEAFDAVSKRHAEILADARKRKLPPPSPVISEDQLYSQYRTEEDEELHGPEEDASPNSRPQQSAASDADDVIEDTEVGDTDTLTADQSELLKKTAKELVGMAQERGISTEGLRTKSDLVKALTA